MSEPQTHQSPDTSQDRPGEGAEERRVTPEEIEEAMATYSGDGQNDDPAGNDAAATLLRESEGILNPDIHGPH